LPKGQRAERLSRLDKGCATDIPFYFEQHADNGLAEAAQAEEFPTLSAVTGSRVPGNCAGCKIERGRPAPQGIDSHDHLIGIHALLTEEQETVP
jgi:hypothetical protein